MNFNELQKSLEGEKELRRKGLKEVLKDEWGFVRKLCHAYKS